MNIEPAVLRHAAHVYEALAEVAEPDTEFASSEVPVYVGHWTSILTKLENEGKTNRQSAYKAMKFLVDAGCVERLQKGTKENPSIIVLNYPPTMDIYKSQGGPTMTSRKSSLQMVRQQVNDIISRVTDLEELHERDQRTSEAKIDFLDRRLRVLEELSKPADAPDQNWRDFA